MWKYSLVGMAAVAVIAGIVTGICKIIKANLEGNSNAYKNLIKKQSIYDELRIENLKEWFLSKGKLTKGNAVFFLAKPCKETSKMFALNRVPDALDKKHSILQVVVDDATNLPVAMRLISFAKLDEELCKNLGEKSYVIIKMI